MKLVDSIASERKLFLEKYGKGVSEEFHAMEMSNFKYERLTSLSRYQGARQRFTKDYTYRISDSFPEIFTDKDIDDPSKLKLPKYRSYLRSYFDAETWNATKDRDENEYDWMLEYVKQIEQKVSNPVVKNHFATGIMKYEFAGSVKVSELYAVLEPMLMSDDDKVELKEKYESLLKLKKGSPSPDFSFENKLGEEVSLKDFRGKLIYMDLWATWCGPCIAESPHFDKLKEEYKDKDIAFVSVCVFDQKPNWESYLVKRKDDLGVNLFEADDEDSFIKDYMVRGIPHFILIDKEGKIIDKNAIRPSDPNIKKEIESYL